MHSTNSHIRTSFTLWLKWEIKFGFWYDFFWVEKLKLFLVLFKIRKIVDNLILKLYVLILLYIYICFFLTKMFPCIYFLGTKKRLIHIFRAIFISVFCIFLVYSVYVFFCHLIYPLYFNFKLKRFLINFH